MRLADFIQLNTETILKEWEAFAATRLPAAAHMRPLELRDHAKQILEAVVKDLSTPQTRGDQAAKSMGLAVVTFAAPETAAQTHAVLRAKSGFDINQLAAEYRALRASVLRLWLDDSAVDVSVLEDVIRFNEAIDQALAESVAHFSAQVDQSRNLLLGMLGHDMRSPLQTIQLTAEYLGALNAGAAVSSAVFRLINSGARIKALLEDLLDFNRTKLGLGINIVPTRQDLRRVLDEELEMIRAAHPDRRVDLEVHGDCVGVWDGTRLQQLIGNLVLNALRYGSADSPVRVLARGDETDLLIEVINRGPTIDPAIRERIFEPLQRGEHEQTPVDEEGHLGLGLYIAREIATAHGGEIRMDSTEGTTVFAVRLPRARLRAGI